MDIVTGRIRSGHIRASPTPRVACAPELVPHALSARYSPCFASRSWRVIAGMERPPHVALEDELVGLSLVGDEKASPVSPRTIKRPTNPVAICLEEASAGDRVRATLAHPLISVDEVAAKRPRLSGGLAGGPPPPPSSLAVPLPQPCSLAPSPPTLSPLITGSSGRFALSSSSSQAASIPPSAQTSPVHRCSFFTLQPSRDGIAEPLPVLASVSSPLFSSPRSSAAVRFDATPWPMQAECASPVAMATDCISASLCLGPTLPQALVSSSHKPSSAASVDAGGLMRSGHGTMRPAALPRASHAQAFLGQPSAPLDYTRGWGAARLGVPLGGEQIGSESYFTSEGF